MIPAAAAAAAAFHVHIDVPVYVDVVDARVADVVSAHIGTAVVDLRPGATATATAPALRFGAGGHEETLQNDGSHGRHEQSAE